MIEYDFENTSGGLYDVLSEILENIVKDIQETFKLDSVKTLYDDVGESNIIGNIDILLTLCRHYHAHPTIRSVDTVSQWKKDYLSTYDRVISSYLVSDEYIKNRRKVIIETFDKLYEWVDEMNP